MGKVAGSLLGDVQLSNESEIMCSFQNPLAAESVKRDQLLNGRIFLDPFLKNFECYVIGGTG